MKLFNPKTKKNEGLFESLIPTFMVGCTTPNMVNGDKGSAVYIVVSAETKDMARDIASANEEFMSHISDKKNFDKNKHLVVFDPDGSYVIGKVMYFEGDPRL